MEFTYIPREDIPYRYGSGWGPRDLDDVDEAFIHHPAMAGEPGPDATYAQDLAYVLRVEQVGYDRFKDADLDEEGIDQWPGDPGAGISYTDLVMPSGRIFAGHDIRRQSSHTAGHNKTGIGIALAGNFINGHEPHPNQVEGALWVLRRHVARGELAKDHTLQPHSAVYSTACPAGAEPYIAAIRAAYISGGEAMARRKPIAADFRRKEVEYRARNLDITCGPSYYAAGHCRKGKHGHSDDSRHFVAPGMALDVSKDPRPGVPISNYEKAHMDLLWLEVDRDPLVNFRKRWLDRLTAGRGTAHEDHFHMDDRPDWFQTGHKLSGALSLDGISVFIDPVSFPNHVPPMNRSGNFTLALGLVAQRAMASIVNPATGRPFYTGLFDGYLGDGSRGSARTVQGFLKIKVDGDPGAGTQAAIKAHLAALKAPVKPAPTPTPAPAPSGPDYSGFTKADIEEAQRLLKQAGWYVGSNTAIDGSPGPNFQKAMDRAQHVLRADGFYHDRLDLLPGPNFMTALRAYLKSLETPEKPAVNITRLAGLNRYETAAMVSKLQPAKDTVYLATSGPDAVVAARLGVVLLARSGSTTLPGDTSQALKRLKPTNIIVVGGTVAIPDEQAAAAYRAAGIQ